MPDPKQKNIKLQDLIFRAITRTFAFLVLAVLLAIIGSLIYGSLPAMRNTISRNVTGCPDATLTEPTTGLSRSATSAPATSSTYK